jgi:acylglycerol lipase
MPVGQPARADESTRPGSDGTPLHVRHWPARGDAWATLLIVHGIGEHSGRYDKTARRFAAAGLDVHAFDLRGHGLSGGPGVYVDHWEDYLDDLELRLMSVRSPDLPMILLGHSMGALISLEYVCSGRPEPKYLVLSAPPMGANVPAWQRVMAPVLSRVAPKFVIANPISGEQLSRDPAVGKAYFADPLVQPRTTARLGAELFSAMSRANKQIGCISVPTLVIHGGDDTLVPTLLSEPLTTNPLVDRKVQASLRHETMNEPEGPEVVAQIVAWIKLRLKEERRTTVGA